MFVNVQRHKITAKDDDTFVRHFQEGFADIRLALPGSIAYYGPYARDTTNLWRSSPEQSDLIEVRTTTVVSQSELTNALMVWADDGGSEA